MAKNGKTRKNKRSMQRRIKRYMFLNSGISNLILSICVLTVVIGTMGSFGILASDVIASDIAGELENPMTLEKLNIAAIDELDNEDEMLKRWMHAIGNKFYFNMGKGFIVHDEQALMNEELINERNKAKAQGLPEFEFVFVEITLGEKVLMSTFPDEQSFMTSGENTLMNKYYNISERPYRKPNGETAGFVRVVLNPFILIGITFALIFLFVFATILSSLVSIILSKIMSKSLTNPLIELHKKMLLLSEGDIEMAMHTELNIAKPMKEINNLTSATNKIMEKMREYTQTLEDQTVELTVQNEELEERGINLINANGKLESMNIQMRDILDNVGQGFIRFEQDLRIHSEYSSECNKLFGKEINGKRLSSLLFPYDLEQSEFMDELLQNILSDSNAPAELYLPLLPEEVIINDRILKIEYVQTHSKKSMISVITDITEKRDLERKMERDQNILKMVVKALVNRSLFIEIAESFEAFIAEGRALGWKFIDNADDNKVYIMRQLHTFKGNFSQFDVIYITESLHVAESNFEKEEDYVEGIFNSIENAYQEDIEIIKSYIGNEFMVREDFFLVEKKRVLEIEKKMQEVLSERDCRVLLPEVRSLCFRPIKDLLKMYPEYTLKLSERMDKMIHSFEIEGSNLLIDELKYQDFCKSLVHVFRNAVDHGIETPDERAEIEKDIVGRIKCSVYSFEDYFEIHISDDGRGIDTDILRNELGVDEYVSDEQLWLRLFEDKVTTKATVTSVSGRGVGLAAVKKEVENLNGEIIVSSKPNKGTQFIFRLPLGVKNDIKSILPINLMKGLLSTSKEYLINYFGTISHSISDIVYSKKINLNELTAIVSLKGVINALILVSVNKKLGEFLANRFMVEPVETEEINNYIEDVVAEISNTIIGNSLGKLDDESDFLHMGIPAIISNQGAYVKYNDAKILTFDIIIDDFEWSIHLIELESVDLEEEELWRE